MHIKSLIPRSLKIGYQVMKRHLADRQSGLSQQFVTPSKIPNIRFTHSISASQPIMPGSFFENKVYNMQQAGQKLNQLVIQPGAVFSFWKGVGYPGRLQGFKKGRNLVAGKVQSAYGGGLCQVSGILYLLAIKTGMEVLERHNHSLDIYQEHERFAPLGADATVAYGYKDLRFRNNTHATIHIRVEATMEAIHAEFRSTEPLATADLVFERHESGQIRTVITRANERIVATSVYQLIRPEPMVHA
jgi:vancomycin resistance protein VanW